MVFVFPDGGGGAALVVTGNLRRILFNDKKFTIGVCEFAIIDPGAEHLVKGASDMREKAFCERGDEWIAVCGGVLVD